MKPVCLVATDLTPVTDEAVLEAARLAHATQSALHVLHVRPVDMPYDAATQAALDRVAAFLRDAHDGLDVEIHVKCGEPARTILVEAERLQAARIVLGDHARNALPGASGSVAERVVRDAEVPVVVVKARRARRAA